MFGGNLSSGRKCLLDTAMDDLKAYLDVFVDDLQLGTGDATDEKLWENPEAGFNENLEALARVLARAREGRL